MWYAGQVMGLIHDIPTNHELLSRIEREAEEALSKISSLIMKESLGENLRVASRL